MPDRAKSVENHGQVLPASALYGGAQPSRAIVQQVRDAIHNAGFLVLTGLFDEHPVDLAVLAQMQYFFALPDADVRKQSVNVQQRKIKHGWMPLYGEPAYEAGTRARVESFDCGNPHAANADNQWPEVADFRADTSALWDRYATAGDALLRLVAIASGMPANFLYERCSTRELSTMRLLHYPGDGDPGRNALTRDVGISAHSDFECITLLYQTAAGLELRDPRGNWHDAPVDDRQVVVLFGDMLETWTNGQIKATGHRVRITVEPRYSMVLFFAVNDDITVQPLPAFTDVDTPAHYPAVTQREHSRRQLRQAEENRDSEVAGQGLRS